MKISLGSKSYPANRYNHRQCFFYLVLGNQDSFTVSGSSGSNPPVICGTNTGEHSMYIGYTKFIKNIRFIWKYSNHETQFTF